MTCRHPDKDCAKLLCGHPLPCPWHTARIELDKDPPEVVIPLTAKAAFRHRQTLAEIAEVLLDASEPKG